MKPTLENFKTNGLLHTPSKMTAFPLTKEGVVFMVQGDSVNLLSRYFLVPFTERLIFSGCELSLICSGNTTLYELPCDLLEFEESDISLLHDWIHVLTPVFAKPLPEGNQITIFPKDSMQLIPGDLLVFNQAQHTAKEQEIWIEILEGELLIGGDATLALTSKNGPFPLLDPTWMMATIQTKIQAVTPVTWKASIHTFTEFFNRALILYNRGKADQDLIHLQERHAEQEKTLAFAFKQMKEVLSSSTLPCLKHTNDPLQQALELIGSELKIDFIFPKHADLFSICDASQIRIRKVSLEKQWWKKDLNPMLGFQGASPVALIDKELVTFAGVKKISKNNASSIDSVAYVFYPPLPIEMNTGKKISFFVLNKHKKLIGALVGFSLIASLASFFVPITTKLLFQYAIPQSSVPMILYLSLGLFFSVIGFAFFYFLRNLCFLKLEGFSAHLVQAGLWDRLLQVSPHFFRGFSAGNLYWRISTVEEIRQLISGQAANLILSGVFSFFSLIIMAVYSPLLTSVAMSTAFFTCLITACLAHLKIPIVHKMFEIQGSIQGILVQMISGVGKLRLAGAEKSAFAHWAMLFAKSKSLQMKAQNIQNIAITIASFLPILSLWMIYFLLITTIGIKGISLPNFLAFNIAFGSFSLAIYPLNVITLQLVNILPIWKRAQVILDEPQEEQKQNIVPEKLSGQIHVDEVVFSYEKGVPPILNNVSLKIEPRELIGIVGPSGSGKSTLLRLLLGFEKPQSGAIYYDHQDLSVLNIRAVRKQIGSVLQNFGIAAGTIYDNLVCGGIFSKEQVQRALYLSGFEKDVDNFPMGLYTYIAMNGETLAGGQRQRLLLARALIAPVSILIFDEATSALDNQTQSQIISHIESLNVTRIIVAQRLSTIRDADRIYVFDKGAIVQTGTFAELEKAPGIFSEMLVRQRL